MRKFMPMLYAFAAVTLTGCNSEQATEQPTKQTTEQETKQNDWTPLNVNSQNMTENNSFAVEIPLSDNRRALRVTALPKGCLIASSALNVNGDTLITDKSSANKHLWRTNKLSDLGLFVLEGVAAEITQMTFKPVPCDSFSKDTIAKSINIELLVSAMPANPSINVKFALSSVIASEIDVESLSILIGLELDLNVNVTEVEFIDDAAIIMKSTHDLTPLANILSQLKSKDEDTISVVIGKCVKQQTGFGLQNLAGFTPRIPGGAGVADGIFVSPTNCAFPQSAPGTINEIARLTAHEIGHFLGLAHPVEANGTEDDLTSTTVNNLMHRVPLAATAKGLTLEQTQRILAHPFVIDL
ncbi:hypothetical protein [Pseudoalteromonas rhizosphaerae]|uniref:Peptidase M10 metallopeptidase domain-containing protein n=1 Tax=Pseudoalteromonas rhizosphaerae TaxID=2518973 RepID=A0ABW8KWY0_9GAMM